MIRAAAVVVAAGEGRRFGGAKTFADLGGRPLLEWSLAAFEAHPGIGEIVLVLADPGSGAGLPRRFPKISALTRGGPRRQDSVANGICRLGPSRGGFVLVHDAARPLVRPDLIDRVLAALESAAAAVPVIPVEDTIKETDGGRVVRTLDRARLARVQTPQGFSLGVLRRALERAETDGFEATDEAALVERLGETVAAVAGDPDNLKITTPRDLRWAEALIDDQNRHRV